MATALFNKDIAIDERVSKIEDYLSDLRLHCDSRRGPEGKIGAQGIPGVRGEVGPRGLPGKDADISECVKAAKEAIEQEYGFYLNKSVLEEIVKHTLIVAGAIDEETGKAILIPGKDGRDGVDGKSGRDGVGRDGVDGAPGRDGRDGVDGKSPKIKLGVVTDGETACASLTESDDSFILDLTLPRGEKGQDGVSNVAGLRGEQGEIGPRGIPGVGITKAEVVEIIQRAIRT